MTHTEQHVPQIAPDAARVSKHKPKPQRALVTHPDPTPERQPLIPPAKTLQPEKPDSRRTWTRPGLVPEPR